jgi:hypothetical protein
MFKNDNGTTNFTYVWLEKLWKTLVKKLKTRRE